MTKMMKRSSTRQHSPRAVAETEMVGPTLFMVSEESGSSAREYPKCSHHLLVRARDTRPRDGREAKQNLHKMCYTRIAMASPVSRRHHKCWEKSWNSPAVKGLTEMAGT